MELKIATWNITRVTGFLLNLCIPFSITAYQSGSVTLKLPQDINPHHLEGVNYRNSENAYYDEQAAHAGHSPTLIEETPW